MFKYPLIAFFKLVRIENLLIIVVTQLAIKYLVFSHYNVYSQFTPLLFVLSLLSTILIAGGGYIINDYFDVKTDKINRPNTVVIDVFIKRRWAMFWHILFNAIGLLIGIYLALKCHNLTLILFQVVSILLLWFYSTHFKKQLLVGNIVVSLLTASVPIIPMVYDYYLSTNNQLILTDKHHSNLYIYVVITISYSLFAFLTSFMREVVKDMEDYNGDFQTGCKTMPIVWGIITSKVFTFFLTIITIGLLLLSCFKLYQLNILIAVYYILTLTVLPLLVLLLLIMRAKTAKDFKIASLLIKFIMLLGITFTLVLKFVL